jgi:hypothetical protein
MRRKFAATGLTVPEWAAFEMTFKMEVDAVLKAAKVRADLAVRVAEEGDPQSPTHTMKVLMGLWPLKLLTATRDQMKKTVGIDAQQQKKFTELQRAPAKQEVAMTRLETLIKGAEGADKR